MVTEFVELGDINSHFSAPEKQINGDEGESEVANSISFICKRALQQVTLCVCSVSLYFSVSRQNIKDPFWEVVSHLEMCGLK